MKWLSSTNLALGFWLVVAPFVLGYAAASPAAAMNDIVLGAVVATFAVWRVLAEETPSMRAVSWVIALAGLWVAAAPFAIGYTAVTQALVNDLVVGLTLAVFGGIRAVRSVPAR